jgi:hypothetical protein
LIALNNFTDKLVVGRVIFSIAVSVGTFFSFAYAAEAQSIPKEGSGASLPGSVDCTEVEIEYVDDPSLTRAENIALMDRALLRSLGKFDDCKTSQTSSSSAGGNSSSDSSGQNTGGGGSVASSDMSGTEKTTTATQSGNVEGDESNTASSGAAGGMANGNSGSQLETPQSSDNGKIPEDIPSADNDSVLQAQIRQAAMNEKDPEIRAKLWDEYRKYKGQSQVE